MNYSDAIIKKRIESLFKKYSLKQIYILSTSGSFYVAKCENHQGKFFVFKMRQKKSKKEKEKFLKEINFWKKLKKINGHRFIIPDKLYCETSKQPEALIYSFLDANSAGHYYYLAKDRIKSVDIAELVNILKFLQDKCTKYYKAPKDFYKNNILNFYRDYAKNCGILKQKKIKLGYEILLKNQAILSSRQLLKFAHNDFNPKNILINKKKNIMFIDWSDISINLLTFDFTFLYLASFNCVKFQKQLLKHFKKYFSSIKGLENLINLNIILLTPKFLKIIMDDEKEIKKQIRVKYVSGRDGLKMLNVNRKAKEYVLKIFSKSLKSLS